MRRALLWALTLVLALASCAKGADRFVSPTGAGMACSLAAPCSVSTFVANVGQAGDVALMIGGTYRGNQEIWTSGLTFRPRTMAERVTVDGQWLVAPGVNNVWLDHLEFTITTRPSAQNALQLGPSNMGINTNGSGTKVTNCVVHDAGGTGIGWWLRAINSEIYGSLLYFNGSSDQDHGIYTQNSAGAKDFVANIAENNYHGGNQGYGNVGLFGYSYLDNFFYDNGFLLPGHGPQQQFIHTGDLPSSNNVVRGNDAGHRWPPSQTASAIDFGGPASNGCSGLIVEDNYFMAAVRFMPAANPCKPQSMKNNVFSEPIAGFSKLAWPVNTYLGQIKPTTPRVHVVRADKYEPGRFNVSIFWAQTPTVPVPFPAGTLVVGQTYAVQGAQDFYGPPVLTFVYAGAPVPFPAGALPVGKPLAFAAPPATGPDFNAYVIRAIGGVSTPTPAPSSTVTPTATATLSPPTPTLTPTPTRTQTSTPSSTPTDTPTMTPTPTPTDAPAIFVCVTATPKPKPTP